ncbi:MAG TPA: DUF4124 domain-containing protein [Gammaproteobacteria bacterium]|nr:DUF4124 domain-containing protein [Gammaproteobacteria bacterium]
MMDPTHVPYLPRALLAFALGLAPAMAIAAEVYKWTGADGEVHFGDHPPSAGAEQIVVRGGSGTADPGRQERTRRLLQEFETERAEQAEREAALAREEDERAAACAQARNRNFEYQNSGYLYEWSADGQKRVLSEAEHRRARAEARADVDKWCD